VLTFDTCAWRATFEHAKDLPVTLLWRLRIATEAVMNSLPAGVALGETLKAVLLERCCGVEIALGTANVLVSKVALAIAQGCFLILGIALASRELDAHSVALIGRSGLATYGLGAASLFLAVFVGLAIAAQRELFSRALHRLHAISNHSWRARLARLRAPLARIDHGLGVAVRAPRRVALAVVLFFCGWLSLGFEAWLILRLLTPQVSLANAISIEALASIVRVLFFFIPAGLGAQELGYYGLLQAFGLPDAAAMAAAFMVIKRTKEVFWISLGYVVLSLLPARISELRNPAG
jgi:uncharacterized protein (TIRG00374 family)